MYLIIFYIPHIIQKKGEAQLPNSTAPEFAQATFALGAARGERCPYGFEPGDSKARQKTVI